VGNNGTKHIEVVEPRELTKAFDPAVVQESVVDFPKSSERRSPFASILLTAMSAADEFIPWGSDVMGRDVQLRSFLASEPVMASAVYSVAIRNASFEWKIISRDPQKDPKQTIRAITDMLNNAQYGKGWVSLMIKTWTDIYTQDNGAFWELIRKEDRPDSPVVHIAHLDSARCLRTGDPTEPVIYTDRLGVQHILKWYQVRTLEEMPSAVET